MSVETQTVLFMGDFHGKFEKAEEWYDQIVRRFKLEPDLLIQVGDFGFWPTSIATPWTKELDHRAVFVDGNHENHDILQNLEECGFHDHEDAWSRCVGDIWEYKKRGSIEDGILYIGGARSIDRHMRTPGQDWFPEEDIQMGEKFEIMERIEEYGPENIHTVVTHEAPVSFDVLGSHHEGEEDSNREFLERVLDEVSPNRWFFGHHHDRMEGKDKGTEWRCIDMIRDDHSKNDFVVADLPI